MTILDNVQSKRKSKNKMAAQKPDNAYMKLEQLIDTQA